MQNKGGTHSPTLCMLALKIWKFLLYKKVRAEISHIRGIDNIEADRCSRIKPDPFDYSLSCKAFAEISEVLQVTPQVDMFASRISNKVDKYVSWKIDPFAWKIDAFSFQWSGKLYLFPPINLLSKTLVKFKIDKPDSSIIITPAWSSLTCLHSIMKLLIDHPVFIPAHCVESPRLLRRPFSWMAWHISTSPVLQEGFQRNRLQPSQKASPLRLSRLSCDSGESLFLGLEAKGIFPRFLSH